jgi:hypothetical protein
MHLAILTLPTSSSLRPGGGEALKFRENFLFCINLFFIANQIVVVSFFYKTIKISEVLLRHFNNN